MLLPFFMSNILSFYTYILYSTSHDRYYIGQCEDLNVRLARHNSGMVSEDSVKMSTRAMIRF
jgi:predicted GIY-YIG superfamily endonuclease